MSYHEITTHDESLKQWEIVLKIQTKKFEHFLFFCNIPFKWNWHSMATVVIGNTSKKMHTFQIVTTIFKIKNKRNVLTRLESIGLLSLSWFPTVTDQFGHKSVN